MESALSRVLQVIQNSSGKRDVSGSSEVNDSFERPCRFSSGTGCWINLAFAELQQRGHQILEASDIHQFLGYFFVGLLFAFLYRSNELEIRLHRLADNSHDFSRDGSRVKERLSVDFSPIRKKILYGLNFGRKSVIQQSVCFI